MGAITAEHVLEQVWSAGGSLDLKGLTEEERAEWRRAAKIAYLRLHRVGREKLNISFGGDTVSIWLTYRSEEDDEDGDEVAPPTWSTPPAVTARTAEFRGRRVPVPSELATPHPLVERLAEASDVEGRLERRDGGQVAPIQHRPAQRMRRIWQALIVEAEFRGYRVSLEHSGSDFWDAGRLLISIGADDCPIVLAGGGNRPLELRFEIGGSARGEHDTWADTASIRLEDQLGAVMTRIEEHAQDQVERRAKELRQLQEQRRRWDAAEAVARRDYVEDYRRATIADRVEAGREARHMRAYSRAIEQHAAGLSAKDRRRALEWAEWIGGYAEEIDPVRAAAGGPVVPEPTDRDLHPYLQRAHQSAWRP